MPEDKKTLTISKKPATKAIDLRTPTLKPTAKQIIDITNNYIEDLETNHKPPSIARYALLFGTSPNQLREWSKEIKELDQALTYIKTLQEAELEEKALTNKFNPNFATFLLKSKHGYKDQANTFVQNNLGIGGEWLTNALQELKEPSNTGNTGNTGKED